MRDAFDLYIDVTAALRAANIRPKDALLHVRLAPLATRRDAASPRRRRAPHARATLPRAAQAVVEDEDGELEPLEGSGVPPPALRGPRFRAQGAAAVEDTDDVEALQAQLVRLGVKETDVVDGQLGERTLEAVRRFQRAAGLAEDGVVGPKTRARLAQTGMLTDAPPGAAGLNLAAAEEITWWLDADTLPAGMAEEGALLELRMAFTAWEEPAGVRFVQCPDEAAATVKVAWADNSARSLDAFDGPGGALAHANAKGITFDSAERWELQGVVHKEREWIPWDVSRSAALKAWTSSNTSAPKGLLLTQAGHVMVQEEYFQLLPVALHEVGHVLGLGHSDDPNDVMSPYYFADRLRLTENDKAAMRELKASQPKPKPLDKDKANQYVKDHQLESVLSDTINAVLPTGTQQPLTFMSNYLADRAAEKGEQ